MMTDRYVIIGTYRNRKYLFYMYNARITKGTKVCLENMMSEERYVCAKYVIK